MSNQNPLDLPGLIASFYENWQRLEDHFKEEPELSDSGYESWQEEQEVICINNHAIVTQIVAYKVASKSELYQKIQWIKSCLEGQYFSSPDDILGFELLDFVNSLDRFFKGGDA